MSVKVRIGFSTSRHLLSYVIRWFTKSKASHAWILVSDSFLGQDMVMQATMGGFQMESFESFKKRHKVVTILDPNFPLDKGVQKAAHWLGFRYDYLGLFGSLFVIMGRWLNRKWKNPLNDSNALFCSEVAVMVLEESGFPGARPLDAPSVSPGDLMEFLRSHKFVTVYHDGDS